jgi:hypothetical protein
LFSKEASIALLPMAVLSLKLRGHSWSSALKRSSPLFAIAGCYIVVWLALANQNFFVTDGHYAFGLHAVPVYFRTLVRLVSPILMFLIPIVFVAKREPEDDPSLLYFGTLLVISVIPYSFLTYSEQIPSRNSYFPSVGLSGIVGLLFAMMWKYSLPSRRLRKASAAFLLGVLFLNIGYIWTRKEPQYVERSAPTLQLLNVLNSDAGAAVGGICVSQFPLHPWIGEETVANFTALESKVTFSNTCSRSGTQTVLEWQPDTSRYVVMSASFVDPPSAP